MIHTLLFVLIYDTQAMARGKPTITADFREALQSNPVIVAAGTTYVLAHLFNWPKSFQRVDAFHGYSSLCAKIRKV